MISEILIVLDLPLHMFKVLTVKNQGYYTNEKFLNDNNSSKDLYNMLKFRREII